MKHIIKFLGALLAVVLIGATFTACADDDKGSANVGLGIKVFFPTKVVTNQPMTINGSGFDAVTEVEFPGGTKVTNFELVGNDMIKVNAPSGIPAEGGKIIVRTADDQAESRLALTVGHTKVTGFSKQPGETAGGGEQITVYGSDLEFVNSVELLDANGEPQLIDHKDFYRKGTSNLIFTVPLKNIYKGTFVGTLHTYDGQSISMPELTYEPAPDEGYWEKVKTVIWQNDGSHGNISWSGDYRFAPESNSTGEEIATIPQDVWEKMKTESFFILAQPNADWYNVRVTTGWWDPNWNVGDIGAGNENIIMNDDGTFYIELNFTDDADFVGALDARHLLFTGEGYTPLQLYFEDEIWHDGPGKKEVEVPVWQNDGSLGVVNWSGDYRFAPASNSTGEECYTVPQDVWEKLKTETFYVTVKGENPQIRVTSGWWSTTWTGGDIQPGNELLTDNGDGTWTLIVNLEGDPLLDVLDAQHLLFTGSGYSVEKIYFIEYVDGSAPSEYDIKTFTVYQNEGGSTEATLTYPYYPSWGDDAGKLRIMRGIGDPAIETLKLSTSSKFIVYKEAGTKGQIQWNDPNWGSFAGVECNDWDGSAETIEVSLTEDMLKCISGEISDGWSNTAIILQGDGLTVTKIVLVP
ncbi:MAG: hypothetical protein IJ618_01885 [Prevotella sp.]|nr:hypothetical protein [Prevotella sp.]